MSKAAFEAKLAAIEQLRSAQSPEGRDAGLRRALAARNNYLAAKAAKVAGEVLARELVPDLCAAFDRFLPPRTDPQCWAKLAIVQALDALGHADPDVFLRGLRHVQMEPVWGGQQDTAGPVRAYCTGALVNCPGIADLDALELLLEPLYDADKTVRAEAARAIARMDRREAALLLRLRALAPESEPEPLAAVLAGVLSIEGRRGIAFVATFLEKEPWAAQEAALALGGTHEPAALKVLLQALQRPIDRETRTTLHLAVALTRLPEAVEFLLREAEGGSRDAVEALRAIPLTGGQRQRLESACEER